MRRLTVDETKAVQRLITWRIDELEQSGKETSREHSLLVDAQEILRQQAEEKDV